MQCSYTVEQQRRHNKQLCSCTYLLGSKSLNIDGKMDRQRLKYLMCFSFKIGSDFSILTVPAVQ